MGTLAPLHHVPPAPPVLKLLSYLVESQVGR